jgi:hypothetical protein
MSAYITLMTPMTDQECLLAALADVGFVRAKVEVHDSPVPLVGYEGASRAQTAHLVIRRQARSEARPTIWDSWRHRPASKRSVSDRRSATLRCKKLGSPK